MKYKLTVEIEGEEISDLELGLDEVKRLVVEEYTSGTNKNDTGSYSFDVVENG